MARMGGISDAQQMCLTWKDDLPTVDFRVEEGSTVLSCAALAASFLRVAPLRSHVDADLGDSVHGLYYLLDGGDLRCAANILYVDG